MAFQFEPQETIHGAVQRIADEQIEKAISELADTTMSSQSKVHQLRKRCKKIRGLLRLVRPELGKTYQKENAWFKETSRKLSSARDAQVLLDTFDDLMDRYHDQIDPLELIPIRQALVFQRTTQEREMKLNERLDTALERMEQARERVTHWTIKENGFSALENGFKKTYKEGQKAHRKAAKTRTTKDLHEWRKRVKYQWYHQRLLQDVWTPVITAQAGELHRLAELLGKEHDLAVFQRHVKDHPGIVGSKEHLELLHELIEERRTELRERIFCLSHRVYAESPRQITRRMGSYWRAWRKASKKKGSASKQPEADPIETPLEVPVIT